MPILPIRWLWAGRAAVRRGQSPRSYEATPGPLVSRVGALDSPGQRSRGSETVSHPPGRRNLRRPCEARGTLRTEFGLRDRRLAGNAGGCPRRAISDGDGRQRRRLATADEEIVIRPP